MFIHAGTKCYIATLTDAEKMDVHTDAGLRTLEVGVLMFYITFFFSSLVCQLLKINDVVS